MRIAHVTDSYLPRLGGIELHIHELVRRQRAAGHDAQVLTCGRDRPRGAVPVQSFPGVRGLLPPAQARQLDRTLTTGGFDVVHAHSSLFSPMAWAAARHASSAGVPTVVTLHSLLPAHGQLTPVLRALSAGRGSRIVWTTVSEAAARPLRRALAGSAVSVLPNGIDPADWREPSRPGGRRELTLISTMRLTRRKRPLELVSILAAIRSQLPASQPLRAVVVGEGPLAAAVQRHARRLGVDDWLVMAGRLGPPEIRRLLSEADLYLSPARAESFGIAALEARCAGVPVIAMSCGGVGEFVRHGVEGYLVADDTQMAAAAVHTLTSPGVLARLSEYNRRTEPRMVWEAVLSQHHEVYGRAGVPSDVVSASPR